MYGYFIPSSLCNATQLTNGPELAQRRKASTRKSRAVLIELYLLYKFGITAPVRAYSAGNRKCKSRNL